jgi:hypothetical protein
MFDIAPPVWFNISAGDYRPNDWSSIMSNNTMADDYAKGVLQDLRTLESLADILDEVEDEINAADDQELGPDEVIKLVELTISNAVRQEYATPDNDAADVVARHLEMFNEYRDSDPMTDAVGMGYALGSTLIQAYFENALDVKFNGSKSFIRSWSVESLEVLVSYGAPGPSWSVESLEVLVSYGGPNTYVVATAGSVEVRCYWGGDEATLQVLGLECIHAYLWDLAVNEGEFNSYLWELAKNGSEF